MSNGLIPCVGAIVHDQTGCLLLIRRGQEPGLGRWSLPGGRVEPGETESQAVVREVIEETGVTVRPERLAGRIRLTAPSGGTYEIADYVCTLIGPASVRAGTEALDVRWVAARDYAQLSVINGLTSALGRWNVLPTA